MSRRPKVPSTLKFLEGVEVSFLLSLKLFNFLFLYEESQVSQFPKGRPVPRAGVTLPALRDPQTHCSGRLRRCPPSPPSPQKPPGATASPAATRRSRSAPEPGDWSLATAQRCPERPRPPNCAPSRPRGVARAPASPSRDRTRRPSRQARWRCGPLRCPGRRPDSQPTPPRPTSALQHTRGRQHPPAAAPECRLSVTMGVRGAGGGRRASGQPTTVSPQSEHWEPRITTQGLVL